MKKSSSLIYAKKKAWKEKQIKIERSKSQCQNSIQLLKEYKEKIKKLKSNFGDRIPLRYGSIDAAKAELQAPWADEDWRQARIEVFLRALELHQAFIENAADQMRSNLILVKRWLSGKTLPADGLKTALETLGLVVPVVSTTFASFPRMFRDFEPHSVGWLLIDEAGQARPQEAAGALWRAKRVVVVGDPLQLEPVVTLPKRIVAAFGKIFDVEGDWWPTHASVQSLADRSMIYGTKLKQFDGREVWVGAPLRVHRRCDNPMFSISNRLSYNNMMVWGRKPSTIQLPESGWIDVPFSGRIDSKHFVPEEGEALKKLLSILIKCESFDPKDVYIISPFRDVVRQIRQKLLAAAFRVPQERVGTVHTTQGKEAAVVILVLGGGGPMNSGAREWAAEKPNLLNVAVSRAKERFYVIGDRSVWKDLGGFSIVAEMLKPLKLEDVDCAVVNLNSGSEPQLSRESRRESL